MGYQEASGGPRTSAGPAFRGGLSPTAEAVSLPGSAVPNPLEFATFLQNRLAATGGTPRARINGGGIDVQDGRTTRLQSANGFSGGEQRDGMTSTGRRKRRRSSSRSDEAEARRKEQRERDRQEIELVRTPIHDDIAAELAEISPDWITITERLMSQPHARDANRIQGKLAELHVDDVIKRLAKTDKFRKALQVNILDGNAKTRAFSFIREGSGVYAKHQVDGTHAEYDNALMVRLPGGECIPTIIEVKAINAALHGDQADHFLRKRHWKRALRPIQRKYGNRIALMYVTTEEGIDPSSDALKEFQADGGYVVIMKPPLHDFREVADKISKSSGHSIDLIGPSLSLTKK